MPNEAHIRIDEGIKRGPKLQRITKARRKRLIPACNSKLVNLDPTQVINRYLTNETTGAIAESLGVHRSGLHQWLLRNCEDEWQQAQIARALTTLEVAKEGLEAADDALSLARAREQLRGAQWELERLFARLYGQKQEITHTVNPVLTFISVAAMPNAAVLPADSIPPIAGESVQVADK